MKLPKAYEPAEYEEDIYALWEKSNAFVPKERGSHNSYSIVVPPPNANGNLHIGHALTLALEDIAVRYHRMKGEAALLLPGADHAGFETQVVYEKQLEKEGKSRFDFSREELYKQVWDFVAANRENFEGQMRKLGASVDWSRYTFTLDDKIVRQAYSTFKKMWDEGLIYRGERLVNFCTFHGTAFADIEVEYKQEKGHLWDIRYPLTDGSGEIVVATTRPETMLGDTAVAVNPKDSRYKQFIGKTAKLPLTNREIPILADDMVDMDFGTGAVKITPAHDPNDFEVAQRHDLPMISVIDFEGNMTHEVPETYRGLAVDTARDQVVKDLAEQGLLVKTEDHEHSVGHCYKCGTTIQPLLKEQWFVDMQPLAKEAIKALNANHIMFYPKAKQDQLVRYLEGLRDWNISRQIAWGIPIPAFQNLEDQTDWIYDERVGEEIIEVGGKHYRRDPDVFDTWFSSGQWPFATLDYPDSDDYKQFYPLSLMETGYDILMPWVARMIMLGLYITGREPFKAVYLHGLVLDEHGAKMSKSKGNVVNPMEMVEKYGSDALRMGIITGQTAGNNQPFTTSKVVGARNFANKLWNIARFIEDKLGEDYTHSGKPDPQTPSDHWILTKLQHSTGKISTDLDNYRFAEAYETLYHTIWDDVADWYIEASKSSSNRPMLGYILETILKLAHPFAPFVTEAIWQTLSLKDDSMLATEKWPEPAGANKGEAESFEQIKTIVSEIRYLLTALHQHGIRLYYHDAPFIAENSELIKQLSRVAEIREVDDGYGLRLVNTNHKAWLDIDHETIERFSQQLQAKIEEQKGTVKQLEDRLANKNYVKGAPKAVVDQTKSQLSAAKEQLAKMSAEHGRFKE
jgi:valyl-tRNA synthetase